MLHKQTASNKGGKPIQNNTSILASNDQDLFTPPLNTYNQKEINYHSTKAAKSIQEDLWIGLPPLFDAVSLCDME